MDKAEKRRRYRATESFCIYCQIEYKAPEKLREHVLDDHPGSIRAGLYEDDDAERGRKQ